jgi:hypothetical protein
MSSELQALIDHGWYAVADRSHHGDTVSRCPVARDMISLFECNQKAQNHWQKDGLSC